jgi:glycosyltransferase involved in cell wall biosynthesis
VEAAGQLWARLPNLTVSIVGDVFGTEHHFRERLERRIGELGLEDVVTLMGERRDALEIMATSDVVVVPSRRAEPFGMVIVEAMALGRPVIATDAGGPAEIITDRVNGLLVQPGSAGALADAIAWLADDPERARRLGEAGRHRAPDFSVQAMTGGVLAVYRELVSER